MRNKMGFAMTSTSTVLQALEGVERLISKAGGKANLPLIYPFRYCLCCWDCEQVCASTTDPTYESR